MIHEFVENLFQDQEGYVYSPTNIIEKEEWNKHFFKWPQGASQLEDHIGRYDNRDVYLSPVLFSKREISPESFKGTYHLWTEFDRSLPENPIPPSMRIQSSLQGKEHWYWRLDKFTTDKIVVEDLNRRIAYHYKADLSAWDYQQVLRPPDTWNHKRNKPVVRLKQDYKMYSIDNFLQFPSPQ
jgi:hypothetical protein